MVRGNWQKRVEQANERKKSNHQRKLAANQVNTLLQQYSRKSDKVIAILQSSDQTSNLSFLKYCKSFFFSGECRARKCKLSHELSLLDHLRKQNYSQADEASDAVSSSLTDLALLCIELKSKNEGSSFHYEDLAYVIANGVIVFDQNRGGVLCDNDISITDVTNDMSNVHIQNNTSFEETYRGVHDNIRVEGNDASGELAQALPVTVLEHIILFLPDYYTGIIPQVCTSWYEIGQSSTSLWKKLILRRKWPEPGFQSNPFSSGCSDHNPQTAWKSYFICNYCAMRNMRSIQSGMQKIVDRKGRDPGFDEINTESINFQSTIAATQLFKSTTGAPSISNSNFCASMKIIDKSDTDPYYKLSDNDSYLADSSVLCAYADGTLRIYETISDVRGKGVSCRQTACVRSILKSKGWSLLDMNSDMSHIFCISSCSQTDELSFNVLLIDEVICNTGGVNDNGKIDSENFKSYNVSTLIHQYIESSMNILEASFNIASNISIKSFINQSLLPCGKGCFFFRLKIVSSTEQVQPNEESIVEIFCIFSVMKRSIVFLDRRPSPFTAATSGALSFVRDSIDDHSCSIFRQDLPHSFSILTVSLDKYVSSEEITSYMHLTTVLRGAWVRGDNLSISLDVIESLSSQSRTLRLSFMKRFQTGFAEISPMSNYRKHVKLTQLTGSDHFTIDFLKSFSLTVEGTIIGIDQISDEHCVILTEIGSISDATWLGEEDDQGIQDEYEGPFTTHALVVNMRTQQIIDGVYFGTRGPVERSFTFSFSGKNDFLACEVGCEAMIITGRDARRAYQSSIDAVLADINHQISSDSAKKKKKNKRLASKTNKKDGFARGMTLRG